VIRLTKLSVSSLLLGLMALGSATAAHATQCSAPSGSALDNTLFSQFGSETGDGCTGGQSKPGEEEHQQGWHYGDDKEYGPLIWHHSHDRWQYPHDSKDCNPSVVPLPPSSLLLVSGALALLILGRRRRPATA